MVRNRVRKTDHGMFSDDTLRAALQLVDRGTSVRGAAAAMGLCYGTLHRYVKRWREGGCEDVLFPRNAARQVLSGALEAQLEEYILRASERGWPLDSTDTRRLAYELAVRHNTRLPDGWASHECAGQDWLKAFKDRHPRVQLRTLRSKRPPGTPAVQETDSSRPLIDRLDELLGGAPPLHMPTPRSTPVAQPPGSLQPSSHSAHLSDLVPVVKMEPMDSFAADCDNSAVQPLQGDYVVVQTDGTDHFYVGQVLTGIDNHGGMEVRRLRRDVNGSFTLFTDSAPAFVPVKNIRTVLPEPRVVTVTFGVNLDHLDIR